jgi:hypothetical protein
MISSEAAPRMRVPDQAFHWAMMAGVTLIVALLGWFGTQLVAMRDDIHTLKDQVPLQVQALDRRVSVVEGRQSDLERAVLGAPRQVNP